MRILVIGSGGREHALVRALAADDVHAAPGNPGIAALAETYPEVAAAPAGILALARKLSPDLVVIGPEAPLVAGAADALRPFYALYFGGMGAKGKNFHANVPIRMGYAKEVDEIQELYLGGKKDEAGAKIPTALIEELSLIGPREKIREDLERWRESVVTTLLLSGDAATLRTAAELVLG